MSKENKEVKKVLVAADSVKALADNLRDVAQGFRAFDNSGLTRDAIVTLIERKVQGRVSRVKIEDVLNAAQGLDSYVTRRK